MPPLPNDDLAFSDEHVLPEEVGELQAALDELKERCSRSGIQCRASESNENSLTLMIPAGRETRGVFVGSLQRARELLNVGFENFVFVGDYLAIASYKDEFIEAAIRGLGTLGSSFMVRRNLFGSSESVGLDSGGATITVQPPQGREKPAIELHSSADRLRAFDPRFSFPIITIKGLQITNQDEAVEALETLTNALFIEIDVRFELPIGLIRDRRPLRRSLRRSRFDREDLQFPACRYDSEPISLYWYARGATGMPLLQFLAYYQCIEYYFPVYSQKDAIRRVRNVLKSPAFRISDDNDVTRLLSTVQAGRREGFGDERSQLRATIHECVDTTDLRSFLSADADRYEFFSKSKAISSIKVPLANPKADLRNEISERIYEIRCKIVHTKISGEDDVDLLLPYSKEAYLVMHDIDLAQYVARQVLVASSRPLDV